jgi:hypothetical protein
LRSPALISARPRAGCHAVLASLSGRYPPLEGRSPTCYSPVCHSTYPLRGFRVRLACVRHAASVDSEPGSNSQVKVVGSRGCSTRGWKPRKHNLFNVDRLLNWLSNVVQFVKCVGGSRPARSRTEAPIGIASRHPLILDGSVSPKRREARRRTVKCLHVLSSFQRTGDRRSATKRLHAGSAVGLAFPSGVSVVWGTLQSY